MYFVTIEYWVLQIRRGPYFTRSIARRSDVLCNRL